MPKAFAGEFENVWGWLIVALQLHYGWEQEFSGDYPRSLALLHYDPRYEADNQDDKQTRHPYSTVSNHRAVSIHPAAAPRAAIHHASVLR